MSIRITKLSLIEETVNETSSMSGYLANMELCSSIQKIYGNLKLIYTNETLIAEENILKEQLQKAM